MSFSRVYGMLIFVLLTLVLTGCVGPIWSTVDINGAEKKLAEAESVDAKSLAPYEYTMAQQYLRKANELWGYSEFGTAREYAEKSKDFAEQAIKKVNADPWNGPPEGAIENGSSSSAL